MIEAWEPLIEDITLSDPDEAPPRHERVESLVICAGDIERLAGVLSTLVRVGDCGANYVIVEPWMPGNVFVQFAGSPREAKLLCEVATIDAPLTERGAEILVERGFQPPGPGIGPNYAKEIELGGDVNEVLLRVTLEAFAILRDAYGCPSNAMIDISLHMGAWDD